MSETEYITVEDHQKSLAAANQEIERKDLTIRNLQSALVAAGHDADCPVVHDGSMDCVPGTCPAYTPNNHAGTMVEQLRQQVHDLRAVVEKYRTVTDDILALVVGTERLSAALNWTEADRKTPNGRQCYEGNEENKRRCKRIRAAFTFDKSTLGGQQGETEQGGEGAKNELRMIMQDLFERREYSRCFYDDDGDCAPWKTCRESFPDCPLVKLAIITDFPMTETD